MATSQQRLVVAVALAVVLFIGSADAWYQCPKGFADCNPHKPGCETCITNDVNNCGGCYKKCKDVYGAITSCYNSCCKYTCKPGFANCDNDWKNGCEVCTDNDPYNCGKCGCKCQKGWTCKYGKCVPPPCPPGWGNCDGKDGCETDLNHNIYNCGSCGYKCPCSLKFGEPICKWGKCYQQCKKNWRYDGVKKCCVQGY